MTTDTIAALATPPGRGALALIRVSGPDSADFVRRMAPNWRGMSHPRQPVLTRLSEPDGGRALDRALVTYFPSPSSYTGEDLVEISTHGGVLIPALVLAQLERVGARVAGPGEFTQRAFLNGKLDLVQAEGIADLVDARSEVGLDAAILQMEGGLSRRLAELREQVVGLEALLAHHLDFPEEDDAPVPVERIVKAGERLVEDMQTLLETAPQGELLREGALVVLAGRPNAGKSSLFNALLGYERAIVTERPGTTTDAIEATVSLEGYPFRLVDTAGLRDSTGDVESLGMEVARKYLKRAEAVLLCVSLEWGWGPEESGFIAELQAETPVVVLWTKADLQGDTDLKAERTGAVTPGDGVGGDGPGWSHTVGTSKQIIVDFRVSVVDGRGLGELRRLLRDHVYQELTRGPIGGAFLTKRRQANGVRTAVTEVKAFVAAIGEGVPAEVAATHLRPAETALEELLGVVSPDDVLERVFADFCIGK